MTLMVVGGGVRSGKSSFALRWARERGARRVFVATARPVDAEMRDRIARHQRERPDFLTLEAPEELAEAIARATADVVVVDCVTFWLSNLLVRGVERDRILVCVDALVDVLGAARCDVGLVTNEVGMSVHPETALGRAFQDLAGFAHQRLARAADELYLAVLGSILRMRPGPVAVVP